MGPADPVGGSSSTIGPCYACAPTIAEPGDWRSRRTRIAGSRADDGVWSAAELERWRNVGDDETDQLIAGLVEMLGEAKSRQLLRSLIENRGIPRTSWPSDVHEYLARTATLPTWRDRRLIAEGESFFQTYGWTAFGLLGCASLPKGYVIRDVAMVLGSTQQLERHVYRRIWETFQFVLDVMSGGGLEPDGPGVRSAQKVRLFHALVRHLILEQTGEPMTVRTSSYAGILAAMSWQPEWGCPISQSYMAATILSFSYVVLDGLEQLGFDDITDAQRRAYLHCWNVVGHVLGVRDQLMAEDMEQAARLYDGVKEPNIVATPEGVALGRAIMRLMADVVPVWLYPLKALPRLLTEELIGSRDAGLLRLRLNPAERLVLQPSLELIRLWNRTKGELNQDLPASGVAARWLFRHLARDLIGRPRGGRRGSYTVPAHLIQSWQL